MHRPRRLIFREPRAPERARDSTLGRARRLNKKRRSTGTRRVAGARQRPELLLDPSLPSDRIRPIRIPPTLTLGQRPPGALVVPSPQRGTSGPQLTREITDTLLFSLHSST
jgi:hypothetical protein